MRTTLGRLATTQYQAYGSRLRGALQNLSSGSKFKKIEGRNASELGISQRFRSQIHRLSESSRAIQKVSSLLSAADNYAQEGQDILSRMNQIALRATDGSISQSHREELSYEFRQLKGELAQLNERAVVGGKQVGTGSSVLLWDSETESINYSQPNGSQVQELKQKMGGNHSDIHSASYAFEGTAITAGTPANVAPVANDSQSYIIDYGQTLTRTAAQGVISSDLDANDDSLTASLVSDVSNGSLTLNSDGSFSYTPSTGFTGTDTFTYNSSDGTATSNTATVSIEVRAPYVAPASEALVNTTTSGTQQTDDDGHKQTIAMDSSGNYVVVWDSVGQDGSQSGVYAQLFDSSGTAVGSEFQVNTETNFDQETPVVAMDDDGDFVIAWRSRSQDGSSGGIYMQRYDSSGTAQGSETQVNTWTTQDQFQPSIAMDASGDFVVSWTSSHGQDGALDGVFAQRYAADGTALGSEFQVNTVTSKDQKDSVVAMNASGEFVIAWSSSGHSDGSKDGVFMQRYDSSGSAVGSEIQVNTATLKDQERPDVVLTDGGEIIAVWQSKNQDGSNWGVYGQMFDNSGAMSGSEFLVNSTTGGSQRYADISLDASDNFVVTWTDEGGADGSGDGIYMRSYDSSGTALSDEILVATTTSGQQSFSGSALGPNSDLVVAWSGNGSGDSTGIFTQKLQLNTVVATAPIAEANTYHVDMDGSLSISAGLGVISNDYDTNSDSLSASLVSTTANGTLSFNADGSFSYTPDASYTGTDTFTYSVSDGGLSSNSATVSIVVTDPTAGGGSSESTAIGDYIVTRDGSRLLYMAQSTDSSSGVSAQQTLMSLKLKNNSIRKVDLRSAGGQNVSDGSGDRSKLTMDDKGRIWVGAKYSGTSGSDYYVPTLVDPKTMELDYGWSAATRQFNGGSESTPLIKIDKDWAHFAVHRERAVYVEEGTEELVSQHLMDAGDKKTLVDLNSFSNVELAGSGLSWSGAQKFHGLSPDGQYAVFETTDSDSTVMVVLNTLNGEWSQHDTQSGAKGIGSVSFDRNNKLYWTDLSSNSLKSARISMAKKPTLHEVKDIRQLNKNAQLGVGTSDLAALGAGLSADGGAVLPDMELQLANGESITVSTSQHSSNLVDLGISQANVDSAEAAQDALPALKDAIQLMSLYRAGIGKASSQLSVSLNHTKSTENHLAVAESRLSDVDIAASTAEAAQMQIRQDSALAMMVQAKTLREQMIRGFLDKAIS